MIERELTIESDSASLPANVALPKGARAFVLFAHGSGSSRHSPRNRYVAEVLNDAGIATLLIDLLTEEEESVDLQTGEHRFDIPLLTGRLVAATHWIANTFAPSPTVGYFGASTGAAAALAAAAEIPHIDAVVSRGGRPDLAGNVLSHVKCPTLLIVGGRDVSVIEINEEALSRLTCEKRLEIVAGASHLFEEPGALEEVATLARDWFLKMLSAN